MTAVAFPFLRLGAGSVRHGTWLVARSGGAATVLGDHLSHWDYAVDLRLTRILEIDLGAAATQLQIPEDELGLSVVATLGVGGHGGIRDRRVVWQGEVSADETRCEIAAELAGSGLSQSVQLTTEIILGRAPRYCGALSPQRPGMRLWRDDLLVQLEPASQRFPVEAVSFRHLAPRQPASALFYLDAGHDLDHDFTGSVRLFLNADQASLMERVSAGDATTLQLIMGQIMAQLLRQALADDDFTPVDAPPGSIRAVLGSWLALAFPDEPLEAVRTLARREGARFETALGAVAAVQVA